MIGHVPKTWCLYLHSFIPSCSFQSALDASVSFAGSANYCPVLVGAFAGARWGRVAVCAHTKGLSHCSSALLAQVTTQAQNFASNWNAQKEFSDIK